MGGAKESWSFHKPLELLYPLDLALIEGYHQSYNFVPLGTPLFLQACNRTNLSDLLDWLRGPIRVGDICGKEKARRSNG